MRTCALFWCTFWFYSNTFWVCQLGTCLGTILPFFFAKILQISQIARASPVHVPLQVTPQIFNWIQVWPLGHPKHQSGFGEAILLLSTILGCSLPCASSFQYRLYTPCNPVLDKQVQEIDWWITFLYWFGCMLLVMAWWKVKFPFNFQTPCIWCLADWNLQLFLIPLTLAKAQIWLKNSSPKALCCPHPASLWPKSTTLISSDHNTFPTWFGGIRCESWIFFSPWEKTSVLLLYLIFRTNSTHPVCVSCLEKALNQSSSSTVLLCPFS